MVLEYFLATTSIFLNSSLTCFSLETPSVSDFVSRMMAGLLASSGRYQPSGLSLQPRNPSWLKVVIYPVPCCTPDSSLSKPRTSFALSRTSSSVRIPLLIVSSKKQNPRCRNIGGVKINYLSFRIPNNSSRLVTYRYFLAISSGTGINSLT